MERMKMETPDGVEQNIEKIAALFPDCVTETADGQGNVKRAINFDKLKEELSHDIAGDGEQRYEFTWPDKRKAALMAGSPVRMALRPCREESVDFDTTHNLYIEGDNLDVLKCLKETYLGKVKMIYIDPPYNTGNDFVYHDDFTSSVDEYAEQSGQRDEQGNRLVTNSDSNGRFHTDWLNMIDPRLKVARDLLTDDGVIFISIDDHEQANLKKVCDEVFGERNFIAQIVWERAYAPINLMKHFSPSHDYVVCYSKNIELAVCNGIPRTDEANYRYSNPDNDPRGVWQSDNLSVGPAVAENIYPITTPSGRVVEPPAGRSWSLSRKAFRERLQDNRIWFGPDGDGVPRLKRFLSELRKTGVTPMTIWKYTEVGHSQDATKSLSKLFDGKKFFDYPKSVDLIKRCVQLYSSKDSLVLDFFSGSATTAHAVMQLNAEDGGNRRYIMVQIPEACKEDSEAAKAEYKTICEIGKERIRRAGKKIREELAAKREKEGLFKDENAPMLDTGFRVLKLDTSNMKDVYYRPEDVSQGDLFGLVDNVKEDRSGEDLLFQVMLECNTPLDSPIEREEIGGKTVYNVNHGFLMACFEAGVSDDVVTAIAKHHPAYAVFRDASMNDDSAATNIDEIFKTFSNDTIRRVI